jgi:hypothetical protein
VHAVPARLVELVVELLEGPRHALAAAAAAARAAALGVAARHGGLGGGARGLRLLVAHVLDDA